MVPCEIFLDNGKVVLAKFGPRRSYGYTNRRRSWELNWAKSVSSPEGNGLYEWSTLLRQWPRWSPRPLRRKHGHHSDERAWHWRYRQLPDLGDYWLNIVGLSARWKDEWHDVPPIKDAFVVNFGNIMEHFTSGVVTGIINSHEPKVFAANTSLYRLFFFKAASENLFWSE